MSDKNIDEMLGSLLSDTTKKIHNIRDYIKTGKDKEKENQVFDRWDLVPVNTPVELVKKVGNFEGKVEAFTAGEKEKKPFIFPHGTTSRSGPVRHKAPDGTRLLLDELANNIYAYKPWFGGKCPVHINQVVKVIAEGEHVGAYVTTADKVPWTLDEGPSSIKLYSIID